MDLQAPPSDETIVLKIDGEKQEGPDCSPQLPASLVPWNQPYPYLGAYPCIQCIYVPKVVVDARNMHITLFMQLLE